MSRVFISYKHEADPDVRIATAVEAALRAAGNEVFIDSLIAFSAHFGVQSKMTHLCSTNCWLPCRAAGWLPNRVSTRA